MEQTVELSVISDAMSIWYTAWECLPNNFVAAILCIRFNVFIFFCGGGGGGLKRLQVQKYLCIIS